MRVLDLFCGGGGAARGYADAGFEVVGVDIEPQSRYPYEFHRADWREFLSNVAPGDYDLIHASPPCQGYSRSTTYGAHVPRLILPVRLALRPLGPYVIENVWDARYTLQNWTLLCGTMFSLPITRHRLFESSFTIDPPPHLPCDGVQTRYARARGWEPHDMVIAGHGSTKGAKEKWKEIMQIDWDVRIEDLSEMVPPAYTRHIGLMYVLSHTGE